ncbi:MAG: hypothetical protein ACM3QZ_10110 [Solirubrobacterales bacterium]
MRHRMTRKGLIFCIMVALFFLMAAEFNALGNSRYIDQKAIDDSLGLYEIENVPTRLLPQGVTQLACLARKTPGSADGTGVSLRLVGKTAKGYVDICPLAFNQPFNIKLFASYDHGKLDIYSQMPFSAFSYAAEYDWNGKTATLLREWQIDPSADRLREARIKLKKGEIKSAIALLNEMQYPLHYINAHEMAGVVLRSAHTKALRELKAGRATKALQTYEDAKDLDLINDLLEVSDRKGFEAYDDAKGISWTQFVCAINDYGYVLEQANRCKGALPVLQRVIKLAPNRTVAYLNLGDVSWKLGQKKDAAGYYREYVRRMTEAKLQKQIPQRVRQRI